jgi:hypothetical protein
MRRHRCRTAFSASESEQPLHLPKYETIVLFYLYTKARHEDLSAEQLKRLRQAASMIKQ